ncbi:hypothetical protein BJ875DRAFT_373602 [Amylocarpus encephaloides]|uniref:SMP-30/Gluconolactonase/LRE-like region domain-containing protein n=1 Tax=Amylocarpus encephaloides TaxID=45428 RepID=A0A9P8C6Z1_9HELO|nr:hypothetical protein BJ875DRAFT_373602 [Amylocarpus encephaloides]
MQIVFSTASPLHTHATPKAPVVRQLYQFPDLTGIENIYVRPNGRLLFSTFETGNLYGLNPAASVPTPIVVAQMTGSSGLTGIVDIGSNKYAVAAGIHSPFNFTEMAIYVVWIPPNRNTGVVLNRIPVPAVINGLVALPLRPWVILGADSNTGKIWRINTRTRAIDVAISNPTFLGAGNPALPLGVNGIKIYNGYLYFTNSGLGTFGRVKVDPRGNKIGNFKIITNLPGGGLGTFTKAYDDFDIDHRGNAYVSLHSASFQKITPAGVQTLWIGSAGAYTTVFEPTSAALSCDGSTVYLATGGIAVGTTVHGGQILETRI